MGDEMNKALEGAEQTVVDFGLEDGQTPFDTEQLTPEQLIGGEEALQELLSYLESEVNDVWEGSPRAEFLSRVAIWRKQRKCQPLQDSKNTPFEGSANLATPMTMQNTHAVSAKLKAMIQQREPRIQVSARKEEFKPHALALEKVMNHFNKSPLHVDIEHLDHDITYETGSLGTQVVEIPWKSQQVNFKRKDPSGGWVSDLKTVFEGPKPEAISLEEFLIRPEWENVQIAPWCGFVRYWMDYDIDEMESIGFFSEVARLRSSPATEFHANREEEERTRGLSNSLGTAENNIYEIVKIYVRWDVDEDGFAEDLIVWYSNSAKMILRIEYNQMGVRPIEVFRYFRIPDSFYGMGIGEMSEFPQREVDTAHNMRVDGTRLHSSQMIVTDTASGLKDNIRIAPGRILKIPGGPQNLKSIAFPDVTGATQIMETVASSYVDRAAGVNDLMKGMPDNVAKSGARVGSQVLQMQRGDSIFDSISKDFRKSYGRLYQYQVMQCVVNGDRSKTYISTLAETEEDGQLLDKIWDMDVADIPYSFDFTIRTTAADETKEAKRQNIMTLTQMYDMFMDRILQMQQAITSGQLPPQMGQTMLDFMVKRYDLMKETFELLGEGDDASDAMPFYEDLSMMVEMMNQMKMQQVDMAKGQMNGRRVEGNNSGMVPDGQQPAGGNTGMGQSGGGQNPNPSTAAEGQSVERRVGGGSPGEVAQASGPGESVQ